MEAKDNQQPDRERGTPTVSKVLPDGSLIELVYNATEGKTQLAQYQNGTAALLDTIDLPSGEHLIPVSPRNNLIRHGALLLPERAEPFAPIDELYQDIASYVRRYLDLSDAFLSIAIAYVLLTWVYDAFNELPYLRFRGDYGSGKTRALLIIGSLCYKPFFASGASTVSPIFHTLDSFGGTLIADETDFRFSDEKAELVKIFNNGNVRGFPVLRSAATPQKTFDPRAFSVFGPKIVAMRHSFDDPALESRFLTEDMGKRQLRPDIPINLPDSQSEEARSLRNRLLWYRFTMLRNTTIDQGAYDERLSPRLNQIMAPLLSVTADAVVRADITRYIGRLDETLRSQRGATSEAQVLEIIFGLKMDGASEYLTIAAITSAFIARYGAEYDRPITPRYIGHLIRNRLRLYTYKRHGSFVLPLTQEEHFTVLATRYGILSGGQGDMGTLEKGEDDGKPTLVSA